MTRTAGPEASLLCGCLDLFRLRGIHAIRINSGQVKIDKRLIRLAPAGTSDVLAVLRPHGRLLACELKSPSGRLTEKQRAFLESVRAAGGAAVVIRDIKTLDRVLSTLDADPWAQFPLEDV